jgi:uncharacterized protein (TIGR02996 family)
MNSDFGFLQAILEEPREPGPRLVYADWLEEQGNPVADARAEYLRVECELDTVPVKPSRRRKLRARIAELQAIVGDEWWQALDCSPVEGCVEFTFRCPQRWDTLLPTSLESMRHCPECKNDVYYCRNIAEAREHAAEGHCVAVDTRKLRLRGDLQPPESRRLLGRVMPQARRRLPLPKRGPARNNTAGGSEAQSRPEGSAG